LKRGFAPLIRPKILGEFRGGASPLFLLSPLPLVKGKGIKRVPRKIEDFSGCLKGIGLPNYYKERGKLFFEGLRPFNLPLINNLYSQGRPPIV